MAVAGTSLGEGVGAGQQEARRPISCVGVASWTYDGHLFALIGPLTFLVVNARVDQAHTPVLLRALAYFVVAVRTAERRPCESTSPQQG